MKLGPRPRGAFDGILPGKSKGAFRPAAPAGLLLNIKEHEMGVRVLRVVVFSAFGRERGRAGLCSNLNLSKQLIKLFKLD